MKKKKRSYSEVTYWESMADGIVGLLFCVLLVVVLLVLYLISVPDEQKMKDLYPGSEYETWSDDDHYREYGTDNQEGDTYADHGGGTDGGGTDGGGGDTEEGDEVGAPEPVPETPIDLRLYPEDSDGSQKAAVYVEVIDGETGKTIKKQGISFELYDSYDGLKTLSTHYPKKVEYKTYETEENGVFFLPEKIPYDHYYLRGLTSITGYETLDHIAFSIDEAHDWDDPYIVTVPYLPCKNTIRIQLKDRNEGNGIPGAVYKIFASEDIVTQDGTVRYRRGTQVDTITLDELGYGESRELYLGRYSILMAEIPECYAVDTAEIDYSVEEKEDAEQSAVLNLAVEKTAVNVHVSDALYENTAIAGAKFSLLAEDGTVINEYTTDSKGRFKITELEHMRTYHLKQESSNGNYIPERFDIALSVDANGLIENEPKAEIRISNRLIRASFGVKDQLFGMDVSDINMVLLDSAGTPIDSWSSSGMQYVIEGLETGSYKVVIAGNEKDAKSVTIEDQAEIQQFSFRRWTVIDTAAAAGAVLAAVLLIALIVMLIRRRKKRKLEAG